MRDRSLAISTHALDLLLQNLEELPECDEGKIIGKDQPNKLVPIDVDLSNVQLILEVRNLSASSAFLTALLLRLQLPQKLDTGHAVLDAQPPMNVSIARMHVRREHDGHVRIEEVPPRGKN